MIRVVTIILMICCFAGGSLAQTGVVKKYMSYGSFSNLLGQMVTTDVFEFANFPTSQVNVSVSGATVTNYVTITVTNLNVIESHTTITNLFPVGPQGPAGTNGVNGVNGTNSLMSFLKTNAPVSASSYDGGTLVLGTNAGSATASGGGVYATNSVSALPYVNTTGTVTAASPYWQVTLTNNMTLDATLTDFPTNMTSALGLSVCYNGYTLTPVSGSKYTASSISLLGTPNTNAGAWNLYSVIKGYGATNLTIQGPIQ